MFTSEELREKATGYGARAQSAQSPVLRRYFLARERECAELARNEEVNSELAVSVQPLSGEALAVEDVLHVSNHQQWLAEEYMLSFALADIVLVDTFPGVTVTPLAERQNLVRKAEFLSWRTRVSCALAVDYNK